MDLLIKDIGLPAHGSIAVFINQSGRAEIYSVTGGVIQNFLVRREAEQLHQHGKLIDKNTLGVYEAESIAAEEFNHDPDNEYLEGVKDGLHQAAKLISVAKVIVEAN